MNTQPIFIQVGDLAEGFAPDSHILPAVSDFAGQTLRLHFADGSVIEHAFETASDLNWTVVAGAEAGQSGVDTRGSFTCFITYPVDDGAECGLGHGL